MIHLIEVHGGSDPDRTGDIVFVHGLRGNAREYWQHDSRPETFWPEWLAKEKDLPGVSIWSLGYDAAAFEWAGGAMPLYVRATNALDLLSLSNIGDVPIVFVTHSLGGLLVKQMLRNAKELKQPRYKSIADKTSGLVFISTPHSGSDLANYVGYLGWLLRGSVAVKDLEANTPQLLQLNTWYRENVGFEAEGDLGIKSLVYYEERKTRWRFFKLLGATVVDRVSADPGIKGVLPVGLDFDHSTIHQPESTSSQLYKGVKRHIQECLFPDFR
jgi:pimeloyl-ACP methyl ester carboxylesterase